MVQISMVSLIRTERRLDLYKRDRLRPVLIVIGQYQLVIEHIYRIHECINQAFLKISVLRIPMTKLIKPRRHLFTGKLRLLQFGSLDIDKDFFLLRFQFFEPLLGGRRKDTLLDGFQKV